MRFSFLTVSTVVLSVSTATLARAACPKDIKIGWEEYKPFQFEEAGKVTGSDMDVFELVMKKLGCAFKAEKTPWERTLMNVENGTMLFAAGASVTEDRKKFAFFSEPYDVEKIMPYVLKKNVAKLNLGGIDEILKANYKIAVTAGATFGDEFDGLVKSGKLVKDKNLFEAATEKQAADMVSVGHADIFLASGSGLKFRDDIVDGKKAVFTNETRFMLSKKATDAAFLADVDKAIAVLHKDGSLKKIKAKYFGKK